MNINDYIKLFIRLARDGKSIIWSTSQSIVGNGALGAASLWQGLSPGEQAVTPFYWRPSGRVYPASDLATLTSSGYGVVLVHKTDGSYFTEREFIAKTTTVQTTPTAEAHLAPTRTPMVETAAQEVPFIQP